MSRPLFDNHLKQESSMNPIEPNYNIIKLNNNLYTNASNNHRSLEEWYKIIPGSAFFQGLDSILGQIIVMVYEDPDSEKISTVLFSPLGEMCFNSLTLDHKSRFFVACENLRDEYKKSNVRRALAITLLKTYGSLNTDLKSRISKSSQMRDWDETTAGELASTMQLMSGQTPTQIGNKLINLGFLQPHYIESTVLDVIYADNPETIEANNELVYLLGDQIEQLFDPLTEYSPENQTEPYEPPVLNKNNDDGLTKSICNELLQFQKNTSQVLIDFLQEFVIPLRIAALNGEIKDLTIAKLNQIFPPTIDEITRTNCIFLDALQNALPFGSFEVLKACGITIPYFYKAYMRHEAAMKSFSHLLKGFRSTYSIEIQPQFSERKIESIMNASLNLTKIKLILERLINIKTQGTEEENRQVKIYYQSAIETINSFAKDDLKPYSKRVFTPSGKVLTEICDGIPSLLTYGWLNRKVISVFDAKNLVNGQRDVIILFNDYIIFAKVNHDELEQANCTDTPKKPNVSDILMNSLMSEKPLSNIPSLEVTGYSGICEFEALSLGNHNLKIVLNNAPQTTFVYQVENSSKFMNLLSKAKILNKSTPFHLFKSVTCGLTIYSAAHEIDAFSRETSKSKSALFLNIDIDEQLLKYHGLFAGLSAKFVDEDLISVRSLTITGEKSRYNIDSARLSSLISEIISGLELQRHNYKNDELFTTFIVSNSYLLRSVVNESIEKTRKESPALKQKGFSRQVSRNSSIASRNKPLPKIVDVEKKESLNRKPIRTSGERQLKKTKLKNRLSQLFSSKKHPSGNNQDGSKLHHSSPAPDKVESKLPFTASSEKAQVVGNHSAEQIIKGDSQGESYEESDESNSMDDCRTFESSMTPIFDGDDDVYSQENVQSLIDGFSSENWLVARDNSSKNFGLNLVDHEFNLENQDFGNKLDHGKDVPAGNANPDFKKKKTDQNESSIATHPDPGLEESNRELKTPMISRKLPTFNSLDGEFETPILRVGYDSNEDLNDNDIFYTPKSFENVFPELESMKSFETPTAHQIVGQHLETVNTGRNNEASEKETTPTKATEKNGSPQSPMSFASCQEDNTTDGFQMNNIFWQSPSELNFESLNEFNLENDESFGYLAGVLDNSCIITENMKKSETYKTLPRSYSSIRYLAAYIDNDTPISKELYDFLGE